MQKAADPYKHDVLLVCCFFVIDKILAPHYAAILRSGTESGDFAVDSPLETAEMLLTLSNFYLNTAIFQWPDEDMPGKIRAFELLASKALGTKEFPILDFRQ